MNRETRTGLELLAIYTAFGLLLVAADAQSATHTIRDNPGGEVAKFEDVAKRLGKRDVVRIGGFCDSACTIFAMKWRYQACALPGAVLRFHMPYRGQWADTSQTKVIITGGKAEVAYSAHAWRTQWLGRFPGKLNRLLVTATAKGLVPNPSKTKDPNTMFTVTATDVLPVCKRGK